MRPYLWAICISACTCVPVGSQAQGPLILVSVDGLRPDAIDAAHTPWLDALIAEGSYTPYALCDVPSSTLPNHSTMLTGLTVAEHGVRFNTEVPGVIELRTLHDECAEAGLRSGFYASKSKLRFLAHEQNLEVLLIEERPQALIDRVVEQLLEDPMDFVFVHLRSPDSAGHDQGWMSREYLSAVETVDQQIGQLITAIEDAALDDTHVMITADHGGLGALHFLNVPEVRFIPWIAWGPRIAVGRRLCSAVTQADTPATVLALLGVAVPQSYSGTPVEEAFFDHPSAACVPPVPELGSPCAVLWTPLLALVSLHVLWIWQRGRKRHRSAA